MPKMKIEGVDCEIVNGKSTSDLREMFSGEEGKNIVGLATRWPPRIYVAHDDHTDRRSTFLHEIIEQIKMHYKLKIGEKTIRKLESGILGAYRSVGHELPDPYELESAYVETNGRYL